MSGHWYPCFGLLVKSVQSLQARVDPLFACFYQSIWMSIYTFLVGQFVSFEVSKYDWLKETQDLWFELKDFFSNSLHLRVLPQSNTLISVAMIINWYMSKKFCLEWTRKQRQRLTVVNAHNSVLLSWSVILYHWKVKK